MSETILGGSRFDRYYRNAENFKRHLDRSTSVFDEEVAAIFCEDFLKDRMKNPTIADTVMRNYVKRNPYEHSRHVLINNMAILEKTPGIDTLIKAEREHYKKLYPKTGRIREALIQNDRVNLYSTTPKLKGLKKLLLRLKTMF